MRREKNILQTVWEGKNFLPTRLLEKKNLADQKSPIPPSRVKWSAPYSTESWHVLFSEDYITIFFLALVTDAIGYGCIRLLFKRCTQQIFILNGRFNKTAYMFHSTEKTSFHGSLSFVGVVLDNSNNNNSIKRHKIICSGY